MCVDYGDVNTERNRNFFFYQLIDKVWPTLSRAKYFATIDLLMGFHQVKVDPRDKAKTAFFYNRGLYVYNVMPFDFYNAVATFRFMEQMQETIIGFVVFVYIEDVLIHAETSEKLIEIFSSVIKLLAKARLKCKASKCLLFTQKINYLVLVVPSDGINHEPAQLDKIR